MSKRRSTRGVDPAPARDTRAGAAGPRLPQTRSANASRRAHPPQRPNRRAVAAESARQSFIQEMNSVGLTDLDIDMLIGLRTHGVTSSFVREVRSTGLDPDVDAVLAMKIHDVTPAFVKEVRAMGFDPTRTKSWR